MREVKKNKLAVRIEKSAHEVFAFLLDPKNTPRWVTSITEENVSGWPPEEGTVYTNRSGDGAWNEYVITSIDTDKSFILRAKDGNYHVRYTLTPVTEASTDLEYYEWVIRGTLPAPFTKETLTTLKSVLES